jgi:hypothetical protein
VGRKGIHVSKGYRSGGEGRCSELEMVTEKLGMWFEVPRHGYLVVGGCPSLVPPFDGNLVLALYHAYPSLHYVP